MAAGFKLKQYFTPSHTIGFSHTVGWYEPYYLAYLNLSTFPPDIRPGIHQYIPGKDYTTMMEPTTTIVVKKTLDQGAWAEITMEAISDRDIFNLANSKNSGGLMMPRMNFPYRVWEINLKGRNDSSFPATPVFRGHLVSVDPEILSDKKVAGVMDGAFQIGLRLKSFDQFALMNDTGVSIWYHREQGTTTTYHESFKPTDSITFDNMIQEVVKWMGQGQQTTDFPFTYTYTSKGVAPYTTNFNTQEAEIPTRGRPTWDILRDILTIMSDKEGLQKRYIPTCSISGVVDVMTGGFDKTMPSIDDFMDEQAVTKNTNTAITIPFNLLRTTFSGTVTTEFWLQTTLYDSTGAIIYQSDYDYYKYDPKNVVSEIYTSLPLQDVATYKWNTDLVTAGGFTVATTGKLFSPPTWDVRRSKLSVNYEKLKTFAMTRGGCTVRGLYPSDYKGSANDGCRDGGAIVDGGNGVCPYYTGLYPNPVVGPFALTGTLTFTSGSMTVTGSGTGFTNELTVGQMIRSDVALVWVTVAAIASNTSLTLKATYPATGGAGQGAHKAVMGNGEYGILGAVDNIGLLSNENGENTLCRLHSRKIVECFQNTDTSVRKPIDGVLVFPSGLTTDLVGQYVSAYSVFLGEFVILRVNSQNHELKGNSLVTTLEVFRV